MASLSLTSAVKPFGQCQWARSTGTSGRTSTAVQAPSAFHLDGKSSHLPGSPTQLSMLRAFSGPLKLGRTLRIKSNSSSASDGESAATPKTGGGGSNGAGKGGSGGGGGGDSGDGSNGGNPMASWTILFGVVVGAGGLAGFLKKGSGKSLAAGFIFAATLCFCGALMADPTNVLGKRLALVMVVALGGFMGYKYYKTEKPFTAGIAGVSGLMTLGYLFNL